MLKNKYIWCSFMINIMYFYLPCTMALWGKEIWSGSAFLVVQCDYVRVATYCMSHDNSKVFNRFLSTCVLLKTKKPKSVLVRSTEGFLSIQKSRRHVLWRYVLLTMYNRIKTFINKMSTVHILRHQKIIYIRHLSRWPSAINSCSF